MARRDGTLLVTVRRSKADPFGMGRVGDIRTLCNTPITEKIEHLMLSLPPARRNADGLWMIGYSSLVLLQRKL